MENTLTQITNYLLTQSWHIAILALVIAAASLALKNKSAHVRYLLWLILLAKCLVPPLFNIPLAILPQERLAEPATIPTAPVPVANFEVAERTSSEPPILPLVPAAVPPPPTIIERLARITVYQWLALAWITGAAVFVLAAATKALRTNRSLGSQRRPLPAELQANIEDFFADLGIRTLPKVWLIDGIGQPFVWGLLRGNIYLPANFAKVDNSEHRRDILIHELSHILRFDAVVNSLQIIAQAIFWFHPVVWWANKKIRAEREKCCDEMAIARLGANTKDYSTAIVNALIAEHESTQPIPSLAVAGPVKNIEDRIKTIMKSGKKFYRRPTFITAVAVLLLAAFAVPTTIALTAREQKKPETMDVETLLAKICQAQRPAETMRLEFGYQVMAYPPGSPRWVKTEDAENISRKYVLWSHHYVATISGRRSRLEWSIRIFKNKGDKEPFYSGRTISVFDGSELRSLTETSEDSKTTYTGRRSPRDDNERELLVLLNGVPSDLDGLVNYQEVMKQFELKIIETDTPGVYLLDAVRKEDGMHWQLTIEGNRGFNNVKTVLFRSDGSGSIERETNMTLRKYAGSIWYPAQVERVEYSWKTGEAAERRFVKIKAEFDVDVPEETFKLDFPPGTRVFDVFAKGWVVTGDAKTPNDESEVRQQHLELAEKLKELGKALVVYANDDEEGKYPDSLQQLHKYLKDKDLEWALENVEYLGQGKGAADAPDTAIAYDKTLLEKADGTNVLFNDAHVAFETPERLNKLGISIYGGLGGYGDQPLEKLVVGATILTDKPPRALDVETGKTLELKDSWPSEYDVAWDNDAGGVLMRKPDGPVRMLALGQARNLGEAFVLARGRLNELEQSTVTGVPARISRFILIQTSNNNIVIVEINEFDRNRAFMEWKFLRGHGFFQPSRSPRRRTVPRPTITDRPRIPESTDKVQISFDMRVLEVAGDFLSGIDEALSNELKDYFAGQYPKEKHPTIDSEQLDRFLELASTLKDSKMLVSPRVTILSGEEATIKVETTNGYIAGYTEPAAGEPRPQYRTVTSSIAFTVKGEVDTGSNAIDTDIDFDYDNIEGFEKRMYKDQYAYEQPIIATTHTRTHVVIPDGGSALLGGGQLRAGPNKDDSKNLLIFVTAKKVGGETSE